MDELARLELLMRRLRDPHSGCPWDRRQTMRSLLPHTLEEVYELIDTIERDDVAHLKEELGDYLFQAAFYAQIAAENGWFTLSEIIDALVDKLVGRHPHVFPDGELDGRRLASAAMNEQQIKETWEQFKDRGREQRQMSGALADVPLALPALQRAQKLQKRAARVGFDWPDARGPRRKVDEELAELDCAADRADELELEHELGDLLFSCINLARHLNVDAEQALARANRRFESRFAAVENLAEQGGSTVSQLGIEDLDRLWEQAKALDESLL